MRPATGHTGKQPQKPSTDISGSGHHIPPPDPTGKIYYNYQAGGWKSTTEPQPQHSQQWTGSTYFEEKPSYEEQLEEDEEDNQQATKARATSMPKQPTEQEIMEHNLTHMPYRSWCPICKQGPSYKSILHFQKGFDNQYPTPILTDIDIETGLCSATLVPNTASMMDY